MGYIKLQEVNYAGGNGTIQFYIEYQVLTQELNNNRSLVRAQIVGRRSGANYGYYNNYGSPSNIIIDGLQANFNPKFDYRSTNYNILGTFDRWINHNSDGTKSIYISGYHNSNLSLKTASAGGNIDLPRIPRQADMTSANDFNDEQNPSITFNNVGSFDVRCYLEFAGGIIDKGWIANATSYTFNLTEADRTLLRTKCSNSNNMSVRYVVQTNVRWKYKLLVIFR